MKDWKHRIPDVVLAQFKYNIHREPYEEADNIHDKQFAGLKLRIHLVRQINFHILQTFTPSIFFVILGYTSLFLPAEAVPGRVALGMLTFLALTTMSSSVKNSLPQVSYMTYMDIWVVTCLLFVFSTNILSIIEIAMLKSGKEQSGAKLSKMSKIIIPILFVVFNTFYWPVIIIQYGTDKTTTVH